MLLRRLIPVLLLFALVAGAPPGGAHAAESVRQTVVPLLVDTDPGVDDAVALAWLFQQRSVELVGITTVAGNTTVDNATRNVLTLLDLADREVPVTIGAAAPLAYPLSRVGAFIHGPDGLWFSQQPADISGLPTDAPAAIAAAARAHPGLTILALGPLTNVAQAIERYPADMAGVRVVALAGARQGGNRTVAAETNAYLDPQALEIVLQSDVDLTLVTLDAFNDVTFDSADLIEELATADNPVARFLAQPVAAYAQAQTGGQDVPITLPDAVAAIWVLKPDLGPAAISLVQVIVENGPIRGKTLIAITLNERVQLLATDEELSAIAEAVFFDPSFDLAAALGAILARQPDNALAVFDLREQPVRRMLLRDLTAMPR